MNDKEVIRIVSENNSIVRSVLTTNERVIKQNEKQMEKLSNFIDESVKLIKQLEDRVFQLELESWGKKGEEDFENIKKLDKIIKGVKNE